MPTTQHHIRRTLRNLGKQITGSHIAGTFDFEFEELPTVIDLGVEAGLISGSAEIDFDVRGNFTIPSISITGYRPTTSAEKAAGAVGMFQQQLVPLCPEAHRWLFLAILDQLETGKFSDAIKERVMKELDADASLVPECSEHSTLHRAAQGV
jgi:hypothetical protein